MQTERTQLEAAITARLDTLPTAERTTLQRASVIGPLFRDNALLALDDSAGAAVRSLVDRELALPSVQVAHADELREHAFRHMMTHSGRWSLVSLALIGALAVAPVVADESLGRSTRLIEVNGSKLHVEREGKGPPLLFLHGGLQFFASDFAAERVEFAASRTVVGIDQRGHGHSPDDERPFSYQAMADDTALILRQLQLGPVDVVGESDGGDVGLLLAHDHPELVRRLVVTGANLRAGLPADEAARRVNWSDAQIAERTKVLETQLPPRFRTEYEAVSPDGAGHWQTLLIKSYRLWMTPVILEPASLKTIGIPVLVIAGDHDFASIEDTTEIFRALPKGQLLIVPAAGHGTFRDRPAMMNLAVREFLDAPSK